MRPLSASRLLMISAVASGLTWKDMAGMGAGVAPSEAVLKSPCTGIFDVMPPASGSLNCSGPVP